MHIVVNGSAGQGQANIPITAVAPSAIPTWLAWNIGLLPVYGLLAFWITQILRKRAATQSPDETAHVEMKGA
jgi:hypothetical protein